MLISLEALKTLINGLVSKMQSFRGNWNQSDPTASDYIKNRPFYTETRFAEILPETNFTVDGRIAEISNVIALTAGETYIVNFNGVNYECMAEDGSMANAPFPCTALGNFAEMGGEDTGEPFVMLVLDEEVAAAQKLGIMLMPLDGVTSGTLSISGNTEVTKKIDKIFLPSMDFVSYTKAQNLTSSQQAIAKDNIGVFEFSGDYNDLSNKPTIPTMPNISVKMDKANPTGTGTFSMNRKTSTNIGQYSVAVGDRTTASGSGGSFAEGHLTTASGAGSHAEGRNTISSGVGSHAEGVSTTASETASHAEGDNTKAIGSASHAEGTNTTSNGGNSHAEGYNTIATGQDSHAEGNNTKAIGSASHAENAHAEANGNYSHAEGELTKANGKTSHAEGFDTIASGEYQHVQGKVNIEDAENKYAHIVGNGHGDVRSNAHTLDWDGNAWFAGNIYVGGAGMDDPAAKTIVQAVLDALPTWTGGSY